MEATPAVDRGRTAGVQREHAISTTRHRFRQRRCRIAGECYSAGLQTDGATGSRCCTTEGTGVNFGVGQRPVLKSVQGFVLESMTA